MRQRRPTTDEAVRDSYVQRRDEQGRKLCSWPPCNNLLTGRQTRWCSKTCVGLAFATWDWKAARAKVFERDHGICMKCGCDTVAFGDAWRWYERWLLKEETRLRGYRGSAVRIEPLMQEFRKAFGIPRNKSPWDDLWEADHITPLSEGGKLCDLNNLRTLCIMRGCHKEETRALVKRLAKAKRVQRKHQFGYVPLRFQEGAD